MLSRVLVFILFVSCGSNRPKNRYARARQPAEHLSMLHDFNTDNPVSPNTADRRKDDPISTVREYHANGRNPLWCSDAEWLARTEAAALHRMLVLHGMSQDLEASQCVIHRVPGPENEFLIGEWGPFFEEVTASQILKYDFDGNIIHATGAKEPARSDRSNMGCLLVAINLLAQRTDIQTILHVHPPTVMSVGGLKTDLYHLSQASFFLFGQISKESFDFFDESSFAGVLKRGFAAGKRAMFLNHHGIFAVGRDAAEAFYVAKSITRACDIQVKALAMAQSPEQVITVNDELLVSSTRDMVASPDHSYDGSREWPALIRQVMRRSPDFNI